MNQRTNLCRTLTLHCNKSKQVFFIKQLLPSLIKEKVKIKCEYFILRTK